jgi:hypothetical protein
MRQSDITWVTLEESTNALVTTGDMDQLPKIQLTLFPYLFRKIVKMDTNADDDEDEDDELFKSSQKSADGQEEAYYPTEVPNFDPKCPLNTAVNGCDFLLSYNFERMFAEVVFHKLVTCVNEVNEHTIATIADKLHEYLMVQCILPVPVSKAVKVCRFMVRSLIWLLNPMRHDFMPAFAGFMDARNLALQDWEVH